MEKPAFAAIDKSVGTYLPAAGIDDFVRFVPSKSKTPALRAGIINADQPYQFALPPTWGESRISNTQSGNYCQPRCDEPWVEVKFESAADGLLELIVCPLRKLTPAARATIEEIGDPDYFAPRIGPYLTGDYYDPDTLVEQKVVKQDGLTYYFYELYAPEAISGKPHILAFTTVKDEGCLIFKLTASEKQWKAAEPKLRKMGESFRA
ncbi:unnamed protein product [Pedinophyceae sp. YPF-701]|nr:unnamed protein product [Pedinophyceae sp. YPF-701]